MNKRPVALLALSCLACSLLATPVLADSSVPGPRTITVTSGTKGGYALRLPWGYDARFAAPVVVIVPTPGQKLSDALKSDDWETIADRWGIVLIAPTSQDNDAVASALVAMRRVVKVAPHRLYVYASDRVATLPRVADAQAIATHAASSTPSTPRHVTLTKRQQARDAWAFFDTPIPADATLAGDTPRRITFIVTGLRDDQGQVAVSLWNRKASFDKDDQAVANAVAPIVGGQAEITFTVREPDTYAALFLHDRNCNGKMDTSFGFPLEGFGASGNPKVGFGAPGWDDCHFTLASTDRDRRFIIKTNYLTAP